MKYGIHSPNAPEPIGPYSQATTMARFVFVSGQLGIDPATGEFVSEDVKEQTARILDNIEGILAEAGCDMSDVVKTTVFLTDMGDFKDMNEVYAKRFQAPEPARSAVEVSRLPKGARVEIECIACR